MIANKSSFIMWLILDLQVSTHPIIHCLLSSQNVISEPFLFIAGLIFLLCGSLCSFSSTYGAHFHIILGSCCSGHTFQMVKIFQLLYFECFYNIYAYSNSPSYLFVSNHVNLIKLIPHLTALNLSLFLDIY